MHEQLPGGSTRTPPTRARGRWPERPQSWWWQQSGRPAGGRPAQARGRAPPPDLRRTALGPGAGVQHPWPGRRRRAASTTRPQLLLQVSLAFPREGERGPGQGAAVGSKTPRSAGPHPPILPGGLDPWGRAGSQELAVPGFTSRPCQCRQGLSSWLHDLPVDGDTSSQSGWAPLVHCSWDCVIVTRDLGRLKTKCSRSVSVLTGLWPGGLPPSPRLGWEPPCCWGPGRGAVLGLGGEGRADSRVHGLLELGLPGRPLAPRVPVTGWATDEGAPSRGRCASSSGPHRPPFQGEPGRRGALSGAGAPGAGGAALLPGCRLHGPPYQVAEGRAAPLL